MEIIRIKHHKIDFLIMNKAPIRDDNRLSWKAKGILTFLLCLPDEWELNRAEVAKHAKDGITSLNEGIKELCACGYCKIVPIKDSEGKFRGYDYIISEEPFLNRLDLDNKESNPEIENPNTVFPNTVFPNAENHTLFNNDIIQYLKKYKKDILKILNATEKNKKSKKSFNPESLGGKLAQYMLDEIEKYDPSFETPNMVQWEACFNIMMFSNRKSYEEIKNVIWYAQNNDYWRGIVKNPYVLKAKYDTLLTQLMNLKRREKREEETKGVFDKAKKRFSQEN